MKFIKSLTLAILLLILSYDSFVLAANNDGCTTMSEPYTVETMEGYAYEMSGVWVRYDSYSVCQPSGRTVHIGTYWKKVDAFLADDDLIW